MNRLALLPALLLAACASDPTGQAQTALTVLDGSPEAVGVLAVLNDSATTVGTLDDEVPLNKRAAENLIAWRDGADGARWTSDDRGFETMQQVDDVPWVGAAAIDALVAYAESTGQVPQGGDLLGVWDNTAFTVTEAEATLVLANEGDATLLDDEVPLSSRAVTNLLAARPFATIAQLAAVPQIGPSAMLRLREFARTWAPIAEDGEAGLDASCESEDACGDGLICLGAIAWGSGWCVDDSFADTFVVSSNKTIPDGLATGLLSPVAVSGLASVPIDIAVWIDLAHPDPQSLSYRLIDPNGADALLSAPGEGNRVDILQQSISSDDMINGDWTLEIIDPVAGDVGTLVSWTLYLTSTWD